MSAYFLMHDHTDTAGILCHALKPAAEPQVADATAVITARAKGNRTADDGAVARLQGKAGCRSQIQAEQ
jgi:hypothetical protein